MLELHSWVLSWRLNEDSVSLGDRRAVSCRFPVLGPCTAKLRWPVDDWYHRRAAVMIQSARSRVLVPFDFCSGPATRLLFMQSL